MGVERDVKELVHWVRKWEVINSSIVRFSNNSHLVYPFSSPFDSGNAGGTRGAPTLTCTRETMGVEGKRDKKEAAGVAFAEAEEIDNISVMYARVYDMLSTFVKIDYWSNAVLLQQLLASSLHTWVRQLCVCSGGRLQMHPGRATEELSPPELSWTSDVLESCWQEVIRSNSELWTQSTMMITMRATAMAAAPPAEKIKKRVSDEDCSGIGTEGGLCLELRQRKAGETRKGSDDGKMKTREEEEEEDIMSLHSIVNFAMHYHRMRWLLRAVFLRVDVEMNDIAWRILRSCVRSTLEYNSSTIQNIMCRTAERWLGRAVDGDTRISGSSFQDIMDADVPLVSRVLSMLDDCAANNIARHVTESVVRLCQEKGFKLSHIFLGPLTTLDPAACSACAVPTLRDTVVALEKCMSTFMELRTSILIFFGGMTHYTDEVSELGRERVAMSSQAFSAGFCQDEVLLDFVRTWGLPLLVHACEEEREQTFLSINSATHVKGRQCSEEVDINGSGSSISFWSFPESELLGNTYKGRSFCCSFVPPRPGFATLIFFVTPEPKLISDFESRLAASLQKDLEKLFRKVQKTDASLQGIPREVYQQCVFYLKMTNQLLLPVAASGCEGANATLRGVRKGMQAFFLVCEPSVILTLTGALHAQVIGDHLKDSNNIDNNKSGGSNVEVLDIILELASLLHSKDLFVDCYCGLLAPRLIKMQHALELDMDTEVISRLAVRLGELLAAEPLALLRDIRASMVDPRCVITSMDETQKQQSLLHHVRVVCAARWDKYVPLTMSLSDMWKCFDSNHWFDKKMLCAMESFEHRYKGFGCVTVSRGKAGHQSASCSSNLSTPSGDGGNSNDGENNDTSNSASNRSNSGDVSVDAERPSSWPTSPLGMASLGASGYAMQRRQLSWSLGHGALTIICHGAPQQQQWGKEKKKKYDGHDAAASVQLVISPLGLLVLQALERYGDSSSSPPDSLLCTFDFLHNCLPVTVPKVLLGAMLSSLVRHRIVRRIVHTSGNDSSVEAGKVINTYSLPHSFSDCRKRKIVIDISDAGHHWVQRTQENSVDNMAAAMSVNGIVEVERIKKLEACIVRVMKAKRCLSHADLFAAVSDQLRTHFVLTQPMLKSCLAQLIEREFLAREGRDAYVYLF